MAKAMIRVIYPATVDTPEEAYDMCLPCFNVQLLRSEIGETPQPKEFRAFSANDGYYMCSIVPCISEGQVQEGAVCMPGVHHLTTATDNL